MTLAEFTSKRDISPPSKKKRSRLSHSNKFHQNGAFKKLQTSVLDLLHVHHATNNHENKDIYHGQQQPTSKQSVPPRPSIIKSSDIARVLSKKSVTFASVFETIDNERDVKVELEPIHDKEMVAEEDLVTVAANNSINDRTMIDTDKPTEPYPFRSEVPPPLSSWNSLTDLNTNTTSHPSRKKIINRFTHHHRPKKLRHPLQTTDPISPKNRSNSAPNLTLSSSPSSPPTRPVSISTNTQQSQSKPHTRTWFKLSNIVQFIRSFNIHSHEKQANDTVKTKINPPRSSTGLRPTTELLY